MNVPEKGTPVVVFDSNRGMYFGYVEEIDIDRKIIRLSRARHCFMRAATGMPDCEGNYSLAVVGPIGRSRVGPRVDMIVFDVSKIIQCTDDAVKAWEEAKWKS